MSASLATDRFYLVSFGINGMIGCFASSETDNDYERGTEVMIQTERGKEKGVILRQTAWLQIGSPTVSLGSGRILSRYHSWHEEPFEEHLSRLFEGAGKIIQALFLPVQIVDIEQILHPPTIIVHIIQFGPFDDVSLRTELERRWNVPIQLMNLTNQETLLETQVETCGNSQGCSSCSSGGCGKENCGSGACHSHSESHQHFQNEWQSYLAERRSQTAWKDDTA